MTMSVASQATKWVAVTLAFSVAAQAASAASITVDLTGNASNLVTTHSTYQNVPYSNESLGLADTATGSSVPGTTVSVGDTISGTLLLSNAITVPASSGTGIATINLPATVDLNLFGTGNASNVYYTESLSFYDNGVQVLPSGFGNFSGSGGAFTLGLIGMASTSAFTFNEVTFTSTITSMLDDSFQSASSANFTSFSPNLSIESVASPAQSPVPLPATAWLMLSGLGGFAAFARKPRNA